MDRVFCNGCCIVNRRFVTWNAGKIDPRRTKPWQVFSISVNRRHLADNVPFQQAFEAAIGKCFKAVKACMAALDYAQLERVP
jgi:hypothetical protein